MLVPHIPALYPHEPTCCTMGSHLKSGKREFYCRHPHPHPLIFKSRSESLYHRGMHLKSLTPHSSVCDLGPSAFPGTLAPSWGPQGSFHSNHPPKPDSLSKFYPNILRNPLLLTHHDCKIPLTLSYAVFLFTQVRSS